MGTTTRGKEERQMGIVVWKRGVPQKVLEKRGMKKQSVKYKLRSAERRGVRECEMKLRSARTGGSRSAEWNWGAPKEGGLQSVEWYRGEPIKAEQSTDGIEEYLSQRRSADMGWGKECGMHYRSASGYWEAPIPGWGVWTGGSRVWNGIEERREEELIMEWNRRRSIKAEELRWGLRSAKSGGVALQGGGWGCDMAADVWLIV